MLLLQDLDAATTAAQETTALERLHLKGKKREGAQFPGVVRSIVEEKLGLSWSDVENAVS